MFKKKSPTACPWLNKINQNRKFEAARRSERRIWLWSEDQMHESLLKLKRGQHLTETEAMHVAKVLRDHPNDLKRIQQWYKLSVSTIKRIKGKFRLSKTDRSKEEKELRADWNLKDEIKEYIWSYICPPCEPRTIGKILKQVELKFGEKQSAYRVKQFVKREMNYRFKKGWSRPLKYAAKRTQIIKMLYWTELLNLMVDGKTLVNVDKSSFDRSAKNHYSWLPVGESCPVINDILTGKVTLILGTWNSGEWLAIIVVGKVDSLKFSVFLKLLILLFKNICQDGDLPIVVLDNARTHSSRFTKKVIKDSHFQTRFSAPYWPELAPVEQAFWMIKSKLRSLGGASKINFERPNGFEKIFQLLESIQDTSWIQAWARVIK